MHKVCNTRDMGLRASLPPQERWKAYARDIESLMDRVLDGGLASIHSMSHPAYREAA